MFVIYLEAALREVRICLEIPPGELTELAYADDVDFILENADKAKKIIPTVQTKLATFNLKVNTTKTEITEVGRRKEEWKKVRKLGSLLDTKADIQRRKTLATVAMKDMFKIWIRKNKISEKRLLRLYNALVLPILLYNCGTWAPTKSDLESLNAFHRG